MSSLFLEAEQPEQGLMGSVGRRSRSSAGVLGRYDGAELNVKLGERITFGALGGMPVDSSRDGFEGFDRYFGGLNLEVGPLFGVATVELFTIGPGFGEYLDRAAIGTEVRYFEQGRSLSAFVDFDVYYLSLNTAQIVATWQALDSTYLTLFADYRNVPTLTTRNALQGQGVDSLQDLGKTFDRKEIEALARDRTARAANVSLSASHSLSSRYQLAFDASMSHLSGTPSSGGVEGFDGTGFEFSYAGQFIASDILEPGDIGIVGLRFTDGSNRDTVSGTLSARYPLWRWLRMTPRIRTDYRMEEEGADHVGIGPSLGFDLSVWKLRFDAEAGLDWRLPLLGEASALDYFATFGIRQDF